jgi:hypothetical protein
MSETTRESHNGEHTVGPWEITSISQNTGNIGVGQRDLRILIAEVTNAASFGDMFSGAMKRGGGEFRQDDCHTQFANARLIAAAPDMFEELKRVLETLEAIGDLPSMRATIAAVIAKARGETP